MERVDANAHLALAQLSPSSQQKPSGRNMRSKKKLSLAKMPFSLIMDFAVFTLVLLSTVSSYSIGVISADFPIFGIGEGDSFMKRAVPVVGDMSEMPSSMKDAIHGVKMGVASDICDNAKNNLAIDWDGSPLNYTCYHPKNRLPVIKGMKPIEDCNIPEKYYSKHVCMNEKIAYDVTIPTYGNHRPLWPVYGEYIFVPPQRWLHNLEHGAVVMLYHPCAEPHEVEKLKKLVKDVVTNFIKTRALHGPEAELAKEGQYRFKLLDVAVAPKGSDYYDRKLCPSS
ncbi:uncharacterized protein TNIN_163921 [Trichonephila inaurata madagascariensis]|uniref:DUF3105 domain-containing protein n=1 Tax=Trichonephila inaurata madagascariensis TaxID=2747483 RepID=A0A8X6YMX0_9ARAC|nr:uncharacterized protein TNIN_163921 [Trichonephila inaurata madagascariensis]